MKKGSIFLVLGILLILASVTMLLFSRYQTSHADGEAARLSQTIDTLLPQRSQGFPGMYSNPQMPVLQVEEQDFIALVDFPGFGTTLPVGSSWDTGKLSSFPCRFWGSVYDNSMILGGSSQEGQFDFFDRLDPGATVIVTDMMGCEYTYTVTRIDRASSATYERLSEGGYPLVLFAGNAFSTQYLIVRCDLKS